MILTALSFLARLGALAASIIVLGLGAKFITNRAWNVDFLIYIEVISSLSVLGALIPPYPNFVYDLFWALAWTVAAVFALIVQFFESDCYGFRSSGDVNCATYKAGTAFAFLGALAWFASAFFGGLRILAVIFDVGAFTNRPLYVGAGDREQEEEEEETERGIKGKGLADKADEESPSGEKKKKKKIKGFGNSHVASYFVCYGILGVVLLAVGIPVLLIYAAPAFGGFLLDRTPIPDNINVTLSNPTNDSIGFSVISNVRVPDAVKVSLDPMRVEFFLEDTQPNIIPIVTVDLPKLSFHANQRIELINQTLTLGNLDEFARLIERVAYQPTWRVAGRARTKVHVPPINTWIDINKAVELPGFNNFPEIDIKQFGVQPPDEDGYNVVGEVVVQNPSPASVTLGEVTIGVMVGDIKLGRAFVAVNDIVPGNNTFFVKGMVDVGNIEEDITPILKTEVPYLKKGLIMASAAGETVVYRGKHLPYWEKAFQSIKVSATRPVKPLLMSVVDNSLESVMGLDDDSGFLGDVVSGLVDSVLETLNDLPDGNIDNYTESLSTVAKLVLRILGLLGFI